MLASVASAATGTKAMESNPNYAVKRVPPFGPVRYPIQPHIEVLAADATGNYKVISPDLATDREVDEFFDRNPRIPSSYRSEAKKLLKAIPAK